MKNVYVVIEHYVYESGSHEIIVNVYANKELAKSVFKEVVERETERSWINQEHIIETIIEIQEKLIWE